MTHASRTQATPAVSRSELLTEVVWEGLIAGLIGYATVAILVGAIDVVLGRSFFFTAAMLGETLFYGLRDPAGVVVWPGAVFAYNGVHLVGFLFMGMCAAWFAWLAEKGGELWYVGAVLFLLVALHAFGVLLFMTERLRAAIPAWVVIVPGLVGFAAIVGYLLAVRPAFREELRTWRN